MQSFISVSRTLFISFTICATYLTADTIEPLHLDIVDYADFAQNSPEALSTIKKALLENGIVGIRSVPGYRETAQKLIAAALKFSALSEQIKESYAPNREAGEFLGYELGHEKFLRADGQWVPDDLKASYYAFVPENALNKWPAECELQDSYQNVGRLMLETGRSVLRILGFVPGQFEISTEELFGVGRMLHYHKQSDDTLENPLWCGAHFDHGLFTVLMPAYYFADGQPVPEPMDAGLFVRPPHQPNFYKVVSDDPDLMLFQVGEFGQLATNDAIQATQHYVRKASGKIERYTMALFMSPSFETTICSQSELTSDSRYGGTLGEPCTFGHWHTASLQRFHHKTN